MKYYKFRGRDIIIFKEEFDVLEKETQIAVKNKSPR